MPTLVIITTIFTNVNALQLQHVIGWWSGSVFNNIKPTRSRMRLRFSDKIFFQHNVEYQTQQIRSFLIRVNCTLNKKVATELVKELSKICSFTYVFQKKYCHHSTVEFHTFQIKELIHLILLGSCSRQEQLVVPQRHR